ncbi:MAG: BREX protein BrxB domain-containing protein [Desulfoplanes sp.]
MSKIRRLIQSYGTYIAVPWRDDAAAAQRVIFCVYNEHDERFLRASIDEFEIVTRNAGHDWGLFDLTPTFALWMLQEEYAEEYFLQPELLDDLMPDEYRDFIADRLKTTWTSLLSDANAVIAISGVSSLFGFIKVKDLVDKLAPLVKGRLLVFFPGSYENNNYRLLDGYDGWNYLAVPITAGKEF